jgi:hypothetical protein
MCWQMIDRMLDQIALNNDQYYSTIETMRLIHTPYNKQNLLDFEEISTLKRIIFCTGPKLVP